MAFLRSYAFAGDPMRLGPKRKQAAAGPRAKAARKSAIRVRRLMRMQGDPFLGMVPAAAVAAAPLMGKAMKGLQGAAAGIGGWLQSQQGKAALRGLGGMVGLGGPQTRAPAGFMPGGFDLGPAPRGARAFGGGGGGGGRRSMNVANVKALRRGIRRLEGFKTLVKRVDKLLPSGAKMRQSSGSSGARGHKRGCRCVACR
jgi:hypothetical protein